MRYLPICSRSGSALRRWLMPLSVTAVLLPPVPAAQAQLPAFPGADGAAATNVTGGRGGIVYHVTKLDRNFSDTGVGTLRYGLTDANFTPGVPRTIVFDVGGTFWLGRYAAERGHDNGWDTQSHLNLGSNLTIAGQTAPGGVYIMGGVVKAGSTNVILRNVTIAPGYGMRSFSKPEDGEYPVPGDFPDSYVFDAIDISGQNLMIDHLTAIYATDETISANEAAQNITVQYCSISQGQNYPQWDAEGGGYTGHALGSLLQAGSNFRISILNNLYAHQKGRLPRVGSEIGTGAYNDFRNNVFYNWLSTAGTGASGQPSYNNFIHNFYLAGNGGDNPVGGANSNIITAAGGTGIFNGASSSATRVFQAGNVKDTNKDGDPNDALAAGSGDFSNSSLQASAYNLDIGVTLKATNALRNVLRHAGARWWERDYDIALDNTNAINTVDERLAHEAWTGTGKIMAWADDPFNSNPAEGTEWRALLDLRADTNTLAAPFNRPADWDTDGDGMPNAWELEHGLDPDAADNNGDFDSDGFTNLEEYLNDLAAWPAPGEVRCIASNSRYAELQNWRVYGEPVTIAGLGSVTTSLKWQPSRYDTAVIESAMVVVDAVGQHAGTLRVTNDAALMITNGWLKVACDLDLATNATVAVNSPGQLQVDGVIVNDGRLRLTGSAAMNAGALTNNGLLDIITWNGTLPAVFVNNGTVLDRSAILMESPRLNGLDFEVDIQGYAGHEYQLQYCSDLASGTWTDIGAPIGGADAPLLLTHAGGGAGDRRFYRVSVNP